MRYVKKDKFENTIVLHRCRACGGEWENDKNRYSCPACKYIEPKGQKNELKIIERTRVNTKEGRIICHLVKDGDSVLSSEAE